MTHYDEQRERELQKNQAAQTEDIEYLICTACSVGHTERKFIVKRVPMKRPNIEINRTTPVFIYKCQSCGYVYKSI